jgi:hypothetical protein
MFAGESVAVNPAVDPTPAAEPFAPVSPVAEPVQPVEAAPVEAVTETQLMGETVPVEVAGGESADVFSTGPAAGTVAGVAAGAMAAGSVEATATEAAPEVVAPDQVQAAAPTLDPAHRAAFDSLVERSRSRTQGVDRVAAADAGLADAVVAAVEARGFHCTERTAAEARHELRFEGQPGENLTVALGRLTGEDPEGLRGDDVPFEVRYQSSTFGGEVEAQPAGNGQVVVVADEWSGQATSTVWLRLPLEDYLSADLTVDSGAVARDVGATVAVVRDRMS